MLNRPNFDLEPSEPKLDFISRTQVKEMVGIHLDLLKAIQAKMSQEIQNLPYW